MSIEAVVGLAREVEALRNAVRLLSGLPAKVDHLATTFTQAIEDANSPTRRAAQVVPFSWLATTGSGDDDPEPAVAWLAELTDWVSRVYLPFATSDREFPDCWLWHPAVIEELTWLQQAWQLAYDPETGSVQAAAEWHDRFRPAVAARIRSVGGGSCSLRSHLTGSRRVSISPPPNADWVPAVAHWWTRSRHETPPLPEREDLDAAQGFLRPGR